MQPLAILMLCINYRGHGTYWRAFGFAKTLAAWGHDVTLLCSAQTASAAGEQIIDGVRVVQHVDSRGAGYDMRHALWRVRWLRGKRFDLVHSFETRPTNLLPLLALRRQKTPIVLDWCDWFGAGGSVEERADGWQKRVLRPVETHFEHQYRQLGGRTTVINSVLRDRAVAVGVSAETIALIHNGANTDEIRLIDKQAARQRCRLPANALILAYTGTMFAADADLMADAFNRLLAKVPNAHLLLIGYLNIDFRQRVPTDRLTCTGKLPYTKLLDHVAASDIGWLTLANTNANRGRFPMKIHDFIAAGRPVLVTDVGDMPTFVQQNRLGWVAKPTVDDIVAVTQRVPAQLEQAAFSATTIRQHTDRHLAWRNVTTQLLDIYTQLLEPVA